MEPLALRSFRVQEPLPRDVPPGGYSSSWEEHTASPLTITTAFTTGINQRDTFLGRRQCIVCGASNRADLQHCHIVKVDDQKLVSTTNYFLDSSFNADI
jgi:hypothetical protein